MAGSKTQYLMQAQLGQALGATAWAPPGTLYVALSSAAFNAAADPANFSELPATGGYTRLSIANDTTTWTGATLAVPSVVQNNIDFVWPAATADWPDDPSSVYLADASTGGNLLYGADLAAPIQVLNGATFTIFAGTFVFNED